MELQADGTSGTRPKFLFTSDPAIRVQQTSVTIPATGEVQQLFDQCSCDCSSEPRCNLAAARIGNAGKFICTLLASSGGMVTTDLEIASYGRIGTGPTEPTGCDWQSSMSLTSASSTGTRPFNLFKPQHRSGMFSQNAAITTSEAFTERCNCNCSSEPSCAVAAVRTAGDKFVCTMLTDAGSSVATQLSVDMYTKTIPGATDAPRTCGASFRDSGWAAIGKRPRNLFTDTARVHDYRELQSSTTEAAFTTACMCDCTDRDSCTAATIRAAGTSFVCTMLSTTGGQSGTSMQVQTFLKIGVTSTANTPE